MDKEQEEYKKFLEEQLEWCKVQDNILEEIELKLRQMKEIVEYSLECEVSSEEVMEMNVKLLELKKDVYFLESQLHSIVH